MSELQVERARVAARELGERLRALHFNELSVRSRLAGALVARTTPAAMATAQRRLDGDDDLAAAIRFWHLGITVSQEVLAEFMAPLAIDQLQAAGLVRHDGDDMAALVRISPFEDLLIAHDFDDGGPLDTEHVLGVGIATRTLAGLTPRRHVGDVLDLGTGSGAQALLAAAHADRVVATDLSHRAASMAGLSAGMSGIAELDIRVGDGLAPVEGETFDLIVSNPPFVISPEHDLVFRDSPARADEASRDVVRGAASLLRDEGIACVLTNWVVREGAAETAAPRGWVADLGCDALILHHETRDLISYAERWSMLPLAAGSDAHRQVLDRWLRYFDKIGAASIAAGAIILRKRRGRAHVRVEKMPARPRDGGDQVMRMLASMGRFDGADDPALPDTVFHLVHGHRLEQRLTYGHGQYQPGDALLRLDRSAGVVARVPADLLEALFAIDGKRSIGDIAGDVAAARGMPADALRAGIMPMALRLYELGFVDVSGVGSAT